jgi:hypothetical protein
MELGRACRLDALAESGRIHFEVFRPPPIEVTTNDTLVVHTLNSLSQPSTLHHHGMFFNGSTWFDGAQAVSQW